LANLFFLAAGWQSEVMILYSNIDSNVGGLLNTKPTTLFGTLVVTNSEKSQDVLHSC
jgi:hypothetical protein